MSIYFFSALTTFGLSLVRWMELYVRAALAMAILGIALWPVARALNIGDGRLTAIYSEPSYFVYVTLPAVGYCVHRFVNDRRYGRETLIFLLSYALADSALGFLGLLLIAFFAYAPHLKGRQILAGAIAACALCHGCLAWRAPTSAFESLIEMVVACRQGRIPPPFPAPGLSSYAVLANVFMSPAKASWLIL